MALLSNKEVKTMAIITTLWIIGVILLFVFTSASWETLIFALSGYFIAVGYLLFTQLKPTEKKEIDVTLSYTQMQALEECLLCDKPSMSAKSIARQWINKIRKN